MESPLFDLIKNQIDKLGSEKTSAEVSALKSITAAAEARLAAAKEQAESAQEEAEEWKLKYDIAVKETQLREDALRDEFLRTLADKVKILLQILVQFQFAALFDFASQPSWKHHFLVFQDDI